MKGNRRDTQKMVTQKHKGKEADEIDIQSSDGEGEPSRLLKRETDPTYYPPKGTKRKGNVMEVEERKRKVSRKSKGSKSKATKVCRKKSKAVRKGKKKRTQISDLYDDVETENWAKLLATMIVSRLGDGAHYFTTFMLPSNVHHGFWMHLPKNFCDQHLPACDTSVRLVDETGSTFNTNYILERRGLSGGWRFFSQEKVLSEGDVLIFHLIERCTFQVYFVRVETITGALSLLTLSAGGAGANPEKTEGHKKQSCTGSFELDPESPENDEEGVPSSSTEPSHESERKGRDVLKQPNVNNNLCFPKTPRFHGRRSHGGVTCA